MKIEMFKASVKDKKPSIRTKDLAPVIDLLKYPKNSKFDIFLEINGEYEQLRFHLSRPKDKETGLCCQTLYGEQEWNNKWPTIGTGKKTDVRFLRIKVVSIPGHLKENGQYV